MMRRVAADRAEKQAKVQDELAQALNDPQKALAKAGNPPAADQAAQQQNQIADRGT